MRLFKKRCKKPKTTYGIVYMNDESIIRPKKVPYLIVTNKNNIHPKRNAYVPKIISLGEDDKVSFRDMLKSTPTN